MMDQGVPLHRDDASHWLQQVKDKADKQAFIALFNYFAPRIKAYVRRQNVGNEAAEDLTQEIMLQIWNKAGQFDSSKARASTWVFTIARNRLIDYWRAHKGERLEVSDDGLAATQSYEPQQQVEDAQDHARIHSALAELPQAQRTLVEDSFLKERSHASIAQARKIPLGTVKSRLRLALERLRKTVERSAT